MPQTIPRGMDELQTHTSPTFQPFNLEDDGYSSSISSLLLLKESPFSHVEAESSNTVIMPVTVPEVTDIEEQLASMKVAQDKLLKESVKKKAQIKRQNK